MFGPGGRQRYEAKVVECGGVDPLLFTGDETSLISVSGHLVPKTDESDIKDYLVHATGYLTHEEFKAVKSFESHNYLTSGFVQEPKLRQVGEQVIVVTKVTILTFKIYTTRGNGVGSLSPRN